MTRKWHALVAGATILAGAACAERTPTGQDAGIASAALSAAFATTPVGYGDLTSSYVGLTAAGFSDASLWIGGGRDASFGRGSLMGGGIGDALGPHKLPGYEPG